MQHVDSSHVWEIGYENGDLHVRYWPSPKHPDGRLVRYIGVDPKTAESVISAPSVGSALHTFVKGRFEFAG